ncbi:MAG: cupin domain-containing protein [Dehalococcoidia bacterium]|nr:cupin domain-containing protein [Dehalococcoidia bacterium]
MGAIRKNTGGLAAPRWGDVPQLDYRGDNAEGATKQVLVSPADGASFAIRYFEVPVGHASTLEQHRHEHGVVILRGRARVRLGDTVGEATVGDVVFIGSEEIHQLESVGDEPLGFLCVVPGWAEKDASASRSVLDE